MGQKVENPDSIPGFTNIGKYLVLDVETGGTDPAIHSLLSLAMVALDKGKIVDTLDLEIAENKGEPIGGVQPEMVVTEGALRVNNLDAERIHEEGLSPKEAFYAIEYFLNKNFRAPNYNNLITIVGHNVKFDLWFFQRLLKHARVRRDWWDDRFTKHYVDTLAYVVMMKEALGMPPTKLKLENCLEQFGIEVEGQSHSALVDAISTAKLFVKLCQTINPNYP